MKLFVPILSTAFLVGSSLSSLGQVQVPTAEIPQANVPVAPTPNQTPATDQTLPTDAQPANPAPSSANGAADPGLPQAPTSASVTVMTAEELASLNAETLENPFLTSSASQGAINAANAQRAANNFSLAGVIHVGQSKIAVVRELAANGRASANAPIQYLSSQGDSVLKIASAPDLKLSVININVSSVDLEVEGTSEVVSLR